MRFKTDTQLRNLKPKAARYQVGSATQTGLYLRVSPTGAKTFVFIYKRRGKQTRITLGRYGKKQDGLMPLTEANRLAAQYAAETDQGEDPGAVKRAMRQTNLNAPTVAKLVDYYIEVYAKPNKRSWREDLRIFEHDLLPRLGAVKAKDITKREIIDMIDAIAARAPVQANRTLAAIRGLFNFAVDRDIVTISPCYRVKPPTKETSRARVLSHAEIRTLWNTLGEYDGMHEIIKLILLFLLATGQRVGEVRQMQANELGGNNRFQPPEADAHQPAWRMDDNFDFDPDSVGLELWRIPAERTKNKRIHFVPLNSVAKKILTDAERISRSNALESYIFTSPRTGAPMKTSTINHAVTRFVKDTDMEPWTPHDLRRTVATKFGAMQIPRTVQDAAFNHVNNSVSATYDRHSYLPEVCEAMTRWADQLRDIAQVEIDELSKADAEWRRMRLATM